MGLRISAQGVRSVQARGLGAGGGAGLVELRITRIVRRQKQPNRANREVLNKITESRWMTPESVLCCQVVRDD